MDYEAKQLAQIFFNRFNGDYSLALERAEFARKTAGSKAEANLWKNVATEIRKLQGLQLVQKEIK